MPSLRTPQLPRSPGTIATVAGAVGVVVAAFLPWVATGDATRTSFELAQAAERLDLLAGRAQEAGAAAWYLVPALVALVWLAATFDRRRLTAMLGALVGALAVAAATLVLASPLKAAAGVPMALVAGGAALAGAALTAREGSRGR